MSLPSKIISSYVTTGTEEGSVRVLSPMYESQIVAALFWMYKKLTSIEDLT